MKVEPTRSLLPPETRTPRVRLGTLINLRWLAIAGQTITVAVAAVVLRLPMELGLCFLAIGMAVVTNLTAIAAFPRTLRLAERAVFAWLMFDLVQVSVLLFLTGGLHNPFALLTLAPVTISATTLSMRSTFTLAAVAVVTVSLLGGFHMPLRMPDGAVLSLLPLQLVGFWAAIVICTLFLAGFASRLALETDRMSRALLATQTALEREQKLQDLGGVVAATAHELGTPLATITLVSAELAEELADRPELLEDALLIRGQADRCRDILRSMGRAGKSDRHLRTAPLEAVLQEAAEPHADRGVELVYDIAPFDGGQDRQPQIRREPEVIHGLRNLIQNAVDFAEMRVWIDARWSADEIAVRIIDDGPGYLPELIPRLGDPFFRNRPRRDYDGMGLGLFIAKTLLERTGATIDFANGSRSGRQRPTTRAGAIAEVAWPRSTLAVGALGALGENTKIDD